MKLDDRVWTDAVLTDQSHLGVRLTSDSLEARATSENFFLAGELRLDNLIEIQAVVGRRHSTPASLVLEAYEQLGLRCLDLFEGEFAIAVFEKSQQRVILMRDALGRRPLFFATHGGSIYFGSHAPSVARRAGTPKIDPTELAHFVMQLGPLGSRSIFADVVRVEPGTAVSFELLRSPTSERWWKPDLSPIMLNDGDLLQEIESALNRSVGAILARHKKVAAHLSAGMDSSLAVVTASRQLPAGVRLPALTGSPASASRPSDENFCDEFPVASETARMLGNVDVERIVASNDDWVAVGDRLSHAAGMPFANPWNLGWLVATYARARELGATGLIEATHGNSTLSWVGQGAAVTLLREARLKELLKYIGDIRRYKLGTGLMVVPHAIHAMLPSSIADPLAAMMGIPTYQRRHFLRPGHPAVRAVADEALRAGLWQRRFRSAQRPADRLRGLLWADAGTQRIATEQLFGIELCDPFASKRLVELTLRLEEPKYIHNGYGRRFSRALLHGKVPEIVSAGQARWLQGADWHVGAMKTRKTVLDDLDFAQEDAELSAMLDIPRMRSAVGAWTSGAGNQADMDNAGGVLRAVHAIRFARWAAAGATNDQP